DDDLQVFGYVEVFLGLECGLELCNNRLLILTLSDLDLARRVANLGVVFGKPLRGSLFRRVLDLRVEHLLGEGIGAGDPGLVGRSLCKRDGRKQDGGKKYGSDAQAGILQCSW